MIHSLSLRYSGIRLAQSLLVLALFALPLSLAKAEVRVEEVTSPGGITAWLVRDRTVPVTAIEFEFTDAGAAHDPVGKEGLASMAAALIDEGAGDLDSQAFQGTLSDKSMTIRFSASVNGFSGSFYSLNRYRDEAVGLLHLALTEPRFDDEPVERIRSQFLSSLRSKETDPGTIAGKAMREAVFGSHPYGRPSGGTKDGIAAVTAADMRAFIRTALAKDKLHIGVVGDIDPTELGLLLDTVFGDLPEKGLGDPVTEFTPPPPAGTIVVEEDIPQSTILFAQRGLKLDDPDYYAGMILNHILGGGSFSSELMKEVRVKRGLAYSVYSYQHPMKHAALLRGGGQTQNATVGETLTVMRDVVRHLSEGTINAETVDNAKTYITGSFPLRFTNSSSIASQLVSMQVYDFGIDYLDVRNGRVDKVSVNQVNALAKRLLDPDGLLFVVVGAPTGVDATLPVPPGLE